MTNAPIGPAPADSASGPDAAAGQWPPAAADRPGSDELAELRTENQHMRARLDTRQRRSAALLTVRRAAAAVLAAVAAFAMVASVIGLWAATTTLNTDRWVATVAPLPQNKAVAAAVAEYATGQVFDVLDVEQRLRTALPPRADFVAGPLTGQLKGVVRNTVDDVLRSDRFQAVWVAANRRAHEQALAIVNGTSNVVSAGGDHVNIDLLPLINQVLRQLSAQLPSLFGKQISLPDITSGAIPANLRARVQEAVGVPLPANFAQFTIYDAGRLRAIQRAVVVAKRSLALLVVGTVLALALGLVISPGRRRTVLQFGVWLVIAAVAATAILRAVRAQLLAQVPAGVYRDGVAAAVTTVTAMLRVRGVQLIWLGVLVAVVAYLAGPGRLPVWLRRHAVAGARAGGHWLRTGAARAPGWLGRYRDPVRVAGVVVAVVLALILSSWSALLVIALVLAGFEAAVTVVARARPANVH